MSNRIFQDDRSFEVTDRHTDVEFHVFDETVGSHILAGDVQIKIHVEAGWDSQLASFKINAEEATVLKEFLIAKGY